MSTRFAQAKKGFNREHRLSSYVGPGMFMELKAINKCYYTNFRKNHTNSYSSIEQVDFVQILRSTTITRNNATCLQHMMIIS